MVNQFTQALDDLYTTTWQKRLPGVFDNVFAATPFWFWLKDKGKLKPVRGGRFLETNIEYGTNSTVQWIARGGTVDLSDFRFLTVAQYQWRYLVANIMRYGVDEQQNAGDSQIINWVNAKLNNTEESLVSNLEATLVGGSGANNLPAPSFDGLQFLVPDSANVANSAYNAGGIDPSVYTYWQNQAITMHNIGFAVNGVSYMRHLRNLCMNNRAMDAPDIIVSDMVTYEQYEDAVLPMLRLQNNKLADAGFLNQTFTGIPMVWTPNMFQRLYMLNTRFIEFIYDPGYFFDMTEWKAIPNQVNDRAAQVQLACSFMTNRRRVLGVLDTIDTP
jgi:hypothetical protein